MNKKLQNEKKPKKALLLILEIKCQKYQNFIKRENRKQETGKKQKKRSNHIIGKLTTILKVNKFSQRKRNKNLLDYEITLKTLEFVLNSLKKVQPDFLYSSMYIFPESNGKNS